MTGIIEYFRCNTFEQEILYAPNPRVQLGDALGRFGCRRILLCTNRSMSRGGHVRSIESILGDRLVAVYAEVQPHVQDVQVDEVLALAIDLKGDAIVGMGGGSPIGMAKAVASRFATHPCGHSARAATPGDRLTLPVAAIPTTYSGSEMTNDRYHAFGRQGFGAIYGSKNLKAIVVGGTGEVPIADPQRFRGICGAITKEYKSVLSWWMRLMVWFTKPKRYLGFLYQLATRLGLKIEAPAKAMRQLWSDRGTTGAVAISIENGDGQVKNWKGVGSTDFPMATKGWKLDGGEVDKYITKKLSCGDCPCPCKGIVAVKSRGLTDVRRPD